MVYSETGSHRCCLKWPWPHFVVQMSIKIPVLLSQSHRKLELEADVTKPGWELLTYHFLSQDLKHFKNIGINMDKINNTRYIISNDLHDIILNAVLVSDLYVYIQLNLIISSHAFRIVIFFPLNLTFKTIQWPSFLLLLLEI